jgi:hypothetical protein
MKNLVINGNRVILICLKTDQLLAMAIFFFEMLEFVKVLHLVRVILNLDIDKHI